MWQKYLSFESRSEPLAPWATFYWRLWRNLFLSLWIIGVSLVVGIVGYRLTEPTARDWLDAFLQASMILSGMGPIGELTTNASKLFAALYALYSGLLLLVLTGLVLAPVFHRILHSFHIEDEDDDNDKPSTKASGGTQ